MTEILTHEERQRIFAERSACFEAEHVKPVAQAIAGFALAKTKGGPKPVARKVLTHGAADDSRLARLALETATTAFVKGWSLTRASCALGFAIGRAVEFPDMTEEQAVATGVVVLDLVAETTKAFEIHQMQADRPDKVEGGLKYTLGYELRAKSGAFFEDAAEFGKIGMPQFTKEVPAAWSDHKTGGADGQYGGMVHGAGKHMAGVTPDNAPRLYAATNAMQSCRFRVNPVTRAIVREYDESKAFDWLLAHFRAKDAAKPQEKRMLAQMMPKARAIVAQNDTLSGADADAIEAAVIGKAQELADQALERMAKDAARL